MTRWPLMTTLMTRAVQPNGLHRSYPRRSCCTPSIPSSPCPCTPCTALADATTTTYVAIDPSWHPPSRPGRTHSGEHVLRHAHRPRLIQPRPAPVHELEFVPGQQPPGITSTCASPSAVRLTRSSALYTFLSSRCMTSSTCTVQPFLLSMISRFRGHSEPCPSTARSSLVLLPMSVPAVVLSRSSCR